MRMTHREIDAIVGAGFTDDATSSYAPRGEYYSDPALHEFEIEQVFHREWMFFCHQSQIAEAGDYLVVDVAGESLYAMRGQDGEIRVFYNVCQHRGHQLLTGAGSVPKVVTCPYHAWSYDTEGALKGAPKSRQVPNFCAADVKLSQVRTDIIVGFIFVNLDANALPLRQIAPTFEPILLSMVGESEQLQLVKKRSYDIKANWKVVTENFLEAYHVDTSGPAHRSLSNVIDVPTYGFNIAGRTIEYTAQGGTADTLPYDSNESDAFTSTKGAPFHQVFLYPHLTLSVFPGTNMLFVYNMRANGPDRCAEEIMYFAPVSTITEQSATAEAYISEQLNHEDIDLVESVYRGLCSKGYKPGRLMVDAEMQAGWSEQFVHHFNMLHLAALRRD